MPQPFDPITINQMTIPNRFVRSATWEGMATDDGAVTGRLIDLYKQLTEGGLGLIISSHAYVAMAGKATPGQIGIDSDNLLDGLGRLTGAVHAAGGRIAAQLAHAGLFALPDATGGEAPLAPSAVTGFSKTPPRAMASDEIDAVVASFADAAVRAKSAGFDGVQIHAAHGYLLSQFLSPAFNKRSDDYGGTTNNRARIVIEVLAAIRARVGPDYPILIKMNCRDYIENGLELDNFLQVAEMLQENGLDAIEVSGGTLASRKESPSRTGIRTADDEAYFEEAARALKENLRIPIFLVGGIRSYAVAERIISESAADGVSMSRSLIREPDLVNRWKSGDHSPAKCLSDNQCFGPAMAGDGIYCVVDKKGV